MKANPETGKTLVEAVKREIEAREFYLALAEKVRNPLVKRKILGLADDELEHRQTLSRLYWAQTGTEIGSLEDSQDHLDLPDVDNLTVAQLVMLAMEAEKDAAAGYRKIAEESDNARSAGFLEYLAEFEEGHFEVLAAELEKIQRAPGWEDQDPGE